MVKSNGARSMGDSNGSPAQQGPRYRVILHAVAPAGESQRPVRAAGQVHALAGGGGGRGGGHLSPAQNAVLAQIRRPSRNPWSRTVPSPRPNGGSFRVIDTSFSPEHEPTPPPPPLVSARQSVLSPCPVSAVFAWPVPPRGWTVSSTTGRHRYVGASSSSSVPPRGRAPAAAAAAAPAAPDPATGRHRYVGESSSSAAPRAPTPPPAAAPPPAPTAPPAPAPATGGHHYVGESSSSAAPRAPTPPPAAAPPPAPTAPPAPASPPALAAPPAPSSPPAPAPATGGHRYVGESSSSAAPREPTPPPDSAAPPAPPAPLCMLLAGQQVLHEVRPPTGPARARLAATAPEDAFEEYLVERGVIEAPVDAVPWRVVGGSEEAGIVVMAGPVRDRAKLEAAEARERRKNRMEKRKAAAAARAQQPPPPSDAPGSSGGQNKKRGCDGKKKEQA